MNVLVPPIKCQGIKTELVGWIEKNIPSEYSTWVEPFMGTGVVGLNLATGNAKFYDTNIHIIKFYNDIKQRKINSSIATEFLKEQSHNLMKDGQSYYYEIRNRFNNNPDSLDFLFLTRTAFNGVMRFNKSGGFNVPFCKKNDKLNDAHIAKIAEQIKWVSEKIHNNDFHFEVSDYKNSILSAKDDSFIYCDPPYINRNSDYYNGWGHDDEVSLFNLLNNSNSKFMLSSWKSDGKSVNEYVTNGCWSKFNCVEFSHKYIVGGTKERRPSVIEVLVKNYE